MKILIFVLLFLGACTATDHCNYFCSKKGYSGKTTVVKNACFCQVNVFRGKPKKCSG